MTTESPNPDRDYPRLLGERGLIEPAPRRERGYFDQALVFDTTRAQYVWEIAYYPQYNISTSDVRMELFTTKTTSRSCNSGPRGCTR